MRDEEPIWRSLSDVAMLTEIARQGIDHARDVRMNVSANDMQQGERFHSDRAMAGQT